MDEIKSYSGRYDVGGYRLYANCYGNDKPTILFESGLGHGLEDWTFFQPEISKIARTFSYDRAGIGNSDTTKAKKTGLSQVQALHRLLKRVKAKAPYIIVAHSIGGLNARLFAATYPKEVAGIVFIDCSHEKQFLGLRGKQLKEMKDIFDHVEHSYDVIATANEVNKAREKDALRTIPIIVLKAVQPIANQNDLTSLSKRSNLIQVKDSGHFIHSDQPQIVMNAINELIALVKTKKEL